MERYNSCPAAPQSLRNSCKAKKDLYYLLSTNLNLKLIVSPTHTTTPDGLSDTTSGTVVSDFDLPGEGVNSSTCDIAETGCIREAYIGKYMRISTNMSHSLELPDRTEYNTATKSFDLPIVQKYSADDSADIYTAIFNTLCQRYSCRSGKGNNIIFDSDGNLAIKKPNNSVKRISNSSLDVSEQNNFSIKSLDFDIDSLNAANDAGQYQSAKVSVLDMSQQFFMNHSGTFIIYTPKKVGNTPSRGAPVTGSMVMQTYAAAGNPIYYL